ncbi:GxxExxY protein [Fodinibius saliphilus]|uniref:GxxExxY protein n=1 Tax=Fodinibius saliphilus TaxID=1920650 RepID=UPI001107BCCB
MILIIAVEAMSTVFKAQLLTYLKLANNPKGLLIYFHCENIVEQLIPLVSQRFAELPKHK